MNLFYNKGDIYGSIMRFRRHLLNHEHRGQNVKLSTIQQLTINNDYIHLKETLQELFLEPIGDGNINELVQLINKGKLNIVELLVWHREFPEYRLVTLIERYK
jgi:hypothetical protein